MIDFGIFINADLWKHFKRFVWHIDENYCLRLGGVQLNMDADQKLSINPVYYPLFSYMAKPGCNELTVYFSAVSYTILRNHLSFYIMRSMNIAAKEEQDEWENDCDRERPGRRSGHTEMKSCK